MKKNITMRVASALGVAVLLTTCGISGTFAKYTTTGTSTSTARVAKWGVVVSATSEMFKESYNTTIGDTSTAVTVKADSEAAQRNLVAPGTSGTLAKATISGKPEVKVEVTYTGEVTLANWTLADNSTYYCPLRVTVNGTEYYGMGYDDSDAFEKAIEDAINATANKQTIDANTDLSSAGAVTGLTISWKWDFSGTDSKQTDANDTVLGNATTAATIQLNLTTTVTQVD